LVLSKHVTHYGPQSGFLYYNLPATWERAVQWALVTFTSTHKWNI
jgi:hypothetical protein